MGAIGPRTSRTAMNLRASRIIFNGDYRGAADTFREALDPHGEMSFEEFADRIFGGHDDLSGEYVGAFVEGAQAFFEEVRNQL
jgi:hypothetical protein